MAWQRNRAWSGYALVAGTLLVGLFALGQGLPWYGRPVPGLLVDPDLAVSSLTFPTWEGSEQGLRFPDRVVSVEGQAVASGRREGVRHYDDAVSRAIEQGRGTLRLGVQSAGGEVRELDLRFTPIGPMMWWLYAGGMYLVGLLYLGAAALALTVRPEGRLARTFAKAAVLFALFLFTLFDYHTSRQLVVLFEAAFAMVPFAALALALRLPTDVSVLAARPHLERALDGSGAVLAACLVVAHLMGHSTLSLRSVVSVIFGLGLLLSALTFGIRFHRSRGNDRLIMRALFLAMVPGSVVVGVGALLVMLSISHAAAAFCVVPAFALIPLSSTLAFVRHDLWESRALLSRVTTRLVLTAGCAAFAAGLGGGLTALATSTDLTHSIMASSVGSATASLLVLVTLMQADRSLFRSRVAYKPTVEQLSEELTAVTRREQVSIAVENTVRRWLPTDSICFVTNHPQIPQQQAAGQGSPAGQIRIPARFQGKDIGSLRVGPKKGGALYSDQDMDLLRTIANLAAVALAHADRYEEVELRRKQQAQTWRTERAAVVETLAAEIAHEIRYPINFFRSLFKQNAVERVLNFEDIEIGCEEIERLSGLVADLQRVSRRPVVRQWIPVLDLVRKSETLLRDQLGERRFQLEVPEALRIRCDGDQVTQVLVNLMSNAADAGPSKGMGIRWQSLEQGGKIVVWDTGAGFECESAMLFVPFYTTKTTGTGLGLAIAHRIVRAHHWKIDVVRFVAKTSFTIQVPEKDIRFEKLAEGATAAMRNEG